MTHYLTDELIKEYWNTRAEKAGASDRATYGDLQYRKLISDTVKPYLKQTDRVLDIGCGNGYATLEYARLVREIVGVDYSEKMMEAAHQYHLVAAPDIKNVEFRQSDALTLPFSDETFDAVIMERCLINIPDPADKETAVLQARRVLRSGGLFLLTEVTVQGHARLDAFRQKFGLPPIQKHWQNVYIDEDSFIPFLHKRFILEQEYWFDMYEFLSKVVHPLLVAPEEPRFDANINEIARVMSVEFPKFKAPSHAVFWALRKMS